MSLNLAYLGIKGLPSRSGAERAVEAVTQRLADRHASTIYCSGGSLVTFPTAH